MQDMLSPLSAVQTASQLLAQRPSVQKKEDAKFLVAAISAASQLLMGIVSNVLSLRALEAGECKLALAPFDVRDMVAGVLSVCKMSIAHSSTRMEWVDESQPLPQRLLGDRGRLSQILLNLLTSALACNCCLVLLHVCALTAGLCWWHCRCREVHGRQRCGGVRALRTHRRR